MGCDRWIDVCIKVPVLIMKGSLMMLDVIDSPLTRFAQDAERRRIARELHDGVVQSLTALVTDLEYFRMRRPPHANDMTQEMVAKLDLWQAMARESLTSMRQTLGGLRQQSSLERDLRSVLETLMQDMREDGYNVTCECEELPPAFPSEYTSHLYAIAREVLINIRKHAQATAVTCFLFIDEDTLYLSIGDNGVGMQFPAVEARKEGYQQGLIGLRERVLLLDGHLSIESNPGRGTRIDVEIPIRVE